MIRELASIIYDDLSGDQCLAPYLDDASPEEHGLHPCDQPETSHRGRPIRRYEQGWPGDFDRAVVAFGRFGTAPFSLTPQWRQRVSFLVGIWVHSTVTSEDGSTVSPGDLWAGDIYDQIRRILAWDRKRRSCNQDVVVAHREHTGDTVPLTYDNDKRVWYWVANFDWLVVSRGLRAPLAACACT